MVRVSFNIKLFALHFIHRYSVDGATGGYRVRTMNSSFCCLFIVHLHDGYHYSVGKTLHRYNRELHISYNNFS